MPVNATPDDGRAERLAEWVRRMSFEDQIFLTGTTLVLEEIRLRRTDLPHAINEVALREGSPEDAYRAAMELSTAYANQPRYDAPDGVNEHWRIANMTNELAKVIAKYHPKVAGEDR